MKQFFKKLLKWKLSFLARWIIWRYRPGIIGVTGSVGKTSTKYAIDAVLKTSRFTRCSFGNFNTDIGLPLTVLGEWKEVKGFLFWLKVVFSGLTKVLAPLRRSANYPELLILEYAADRPGDIKKLLNIARPNISVITAIGEIPVHVEYYAGPEEVAREKGRLIEYLPSAGFAVLNGDDGAVLGLKDRTRANVMTFGFSRGADMRITNYEVITKDKKPIGVSFKLEYGGSIVLVKLKKVFGRAHCYSAAAAACVGVIFGLNLIAISEALAMYYEPAPGRMRLISGRKKSFIMDDSYNASPVSTHAALDTLRDLPAKRKIAVLGDMTEIGKYTIQAHQEIGEIAAQVADVLVTVGPAAKIIAESAAKSKFKKSHIFQFNDVEEAKGPIEELIKKGDLILVKGSHSMRMAEIVEKLQALDEFDMEATKDD